MMHALKGLTICLIVSLFLFAVATHYSAASCLQQFLAENLPVLSRAALINGFQNDALQQFMHAQLPQILNRLFLENGLGFSLVNGLQITGVSMTTTEAGQGWSLEWGQVWVYWSYSGESVATQVSFGVEYAWWGLCLSAFFCATFVYLLYWLTFESHWMLRPSGAKQTASAVLRTIDAPCLDAMAIQVNSTPVNLDSSQANTLGALNAEQRAWFFKALELGHDTESARQVALSPVSLEIDLCGASLCIHGVNIQLPKTPLFYYFWYALCAQQGRAMVLNPSVSRPQVDAGQELAQLMMRHQGHGRAINDLKTHGLKSKTLDQNRNKIRDELLSVLGDLALPYLFVSERDPVTARYKHGLKLSPCAIQLTYESAEITLVEGD